MKKKTKVDFQFDSKLNLKGSSLLPYRRYEFVAKTTFYNVEYSQNVIVNILNYDVLPVVSIE